MMMKNFSPSQVLLRGVHQLFHQVLERAGFRWEKRRSGQMGLGLWRKKLNENRTHPKRLVVVPGFGDSSATWIVLFLPVFRSLRDYFDEVIFVDFPGYQSFLSHHPAFHSMDFKLKAFHSLLDSLKPHTVMGHSLGGWLVADYAIALSELKPKEEPLWLKELILLAPSGVVEQPEEMVELREIFRRAREHGFKVYRDHCFHKVPFWVNFFSDSVSHFFTREDIQEFLDTFRADHLLNDRIEGLRPEVTLIWGEQDHLLPARWGRVWERLAPKVKSIYLKNIGHCPHLESPVHLAFLLQALLTHRRMGKGWLAWMKPAEGA